MWNDRKSIILSKLFVVIFFLLLVAAAVAAPWLIHGFMRYTRPEVRANEPLFFLTAYFGMLPTGALLALLYLLLRRVERGEVFLRRNVRCLRIISWCCFLGAGIAAVSAVYYLPWAAVAVAGVFMGLIVRVVKNVFARAVTLQEESDFTI
jgi:hypothetical protein